jgi:phage/plasmid-like protein (TIGR03299 family)
MKAVQYDLKGVKTAAEALDLSQCAWEAQPVGMITENGVNVPDHRAIVRSDNNTVVGVVGDRYVPLQNNFAFSFFDTVCEQHNACYDRAYVIDGGHKVILEATINGPIEIRKGDEVLRKIRLINTFDGSYPFTAQFTVWRQICKNGLMGWAKENKCKVHHTKNGEAKAEEALRILATSIEYFQKFEEKCRILAQKIIDQKMVDKFIRECFGEEGGTRQKNLINKVTECYEAGKGTGKGSAWDLYNGYVEWIDHYRSADDETRLANSILGAVDMKERAFTTICELTK